MKRVVLHPRARTELVRSVSFYEEQAPGLGEDFRAEFQDVTARVLAYPESFPYLSGRVRVARMGRFPYNVLYRVEAERIFVLAVMHQRRRPGYWKDRL